VALLAVKSWNVSVPFLMLVAFLVLTFFMGGGARDDILSLVFLRPAAVILCAIGFWGLRWPHIRSNSFLFGMAVAIFVLVGLHLIPLPPSVWWSLPGREIIKNIDKVAELGLVWRPISMVPSTTWNAFFSLFVPLAVLLLSVQISQEEQFKLLQVILVLGLLSGIWGIIQVVGPAYGSFYLYDITNNGSSVGLFSNRNHQAVLLATLFPMLAVYASMVSKSEEQASLRLWLAIAAVVVLVPLLLVTGSRTGLILGVIALISSVFVYSRPTFRTPRKRKTRTFDPRYPIAVFAILCLGALTVVMSRAEALQRLFTTDQSEDGRFEMWYATIQMGWKYFPFGSGIGSFVEVFQIDEPYELLSPSYANHAHNDWLELFMTAGLPAAILVAVALFAFARRCWLLFFSPIRNSREVRFGRLGAIIIIILALGSIGDYPLRTASLACVFVISALWLASNDAIRSKNTGSD
jgi:O-antigen ligase